MDKSPDAFRTISEVADDLDVPQHVLRFWESKFNQIRPMKRGGGRRYYRPNDVELLRGIRHLLYGEGYTIRGVQKLLKDRGIGAIAEIGRNASGLHHDSGDSQSSGSPSFPEDDSIDTSGRADHGLRDDTPSISTSSDSTVDVMAAPLAAAPRLSYAFEEEVSVIHGEFPEPSRRPVMEIDRSRDDVLRTALSDLAEVHCILTGDA